MQQPIGILLFNLGAPSNLDEVAPFLHELFTDPDIYPARIPVFFKKMIGTALARSRIKHSRAIYEAIGGGSPLRDITERQARKLEEHLNSAGLTAHVEVAMRYSSPTADESLGKLLAKGISTLIPLPLYPQFSTVTTGSSLKVLTQSLEKQAGLKILPIIDWCGYPPYIEACARRIEAAVRGAETNSPFQKNERVLLFSAHSLPLRIIKRGDPYLLQTVHTCQRIASELQTDLPWSLSFQSRADMRRWLRPSTQETLIQLGREGVKSVVIFPVSFVSDHSETLYEIDIQYKKLAEEAGIKQLIRVPSFNDDADFIGILASLVQQRISR
ncbi:MAG: ferrochelatase [Deltaproteobacteria bacterium]|nr:ferrochelatase [Deltaproteobacteria bacterium]